MNRPLSGSSLVRLNGENNENGLIVDRLGFSFTQSSRQVPRSRGEVKFMAITEEISSESKKL